MIIERVTELMNNIIADQNERRQLEQLAAQRELYNTTKTYQLLQLLVSVILPVICGIISLINNQFTVWAALYGIIISLIDPFIIDKAVKFKREQAAKIQELFDCQVLKLNTSPLKTSNDKMVEEVLTYYNAHAKIASNIEKIKDWYPLSISVLPIEFARLICQRTNCYWDTRLRCRYAEVVRLIGMSIFIIFLLAACFMNRRFEDNILFGSALMPLLQYCLKQYQEQKEAANRLDKLVSFGKKIWEEDLNKGSDFLLERSRRLQDEIYEHRKSSPSILNFIYNKFRNKDEAIMNNTAEALIDDLIKRNLFNPI